MSTVERLEMATFERLLEIHGGRTERWPEASREPLQRLLEGSALARERWSEAARLDALLDALPEIEPTPDLMARITSLPARHPHVARSGWWPFGNPVTPFFAWGAAAALGVLLGVVAPDLVPIDTDLSGDVASVDVDSLDGDGAGADGADDWTEVSGLAMGADWASEEE
jgi:hypothetical protein